MIRQVKGGQMPKIGSPRPAPDVLKTFATTLAGTIDKAAALSVNPGSRPFQRLTRTEYAISVKDLLGVEVDVAALLPPDTISEGFDNIADRAAFLRNINGRIYARRLAHQSRCSWRPKAEPGSAVTRFLERRRSWIIRKALRSVLVAASPLFTTFRRTANTNSEAYCT